MHDLMAVFSVVMGLWLGVARLLLQASELSS